MSDGNIHINLLGPLEVLQNGEPVEFPPSRKTRGLLGYLITTGRSHSRRHLCDLLWEGPADPRASLRWSLSKIRSLLNDNRMERIVTNRNMVGFNAEGLTTDLYQIHSINAHNSDQCPLSKLEELVLLFRGPFLEDCEVTEAYRYDNWLSSQRETINRIQHQLLVSLIDRLNNHPQKAIHYTRRLLQLDPYDEQAHIRLIHLLGQNGETKKALNQYRQCRNMLENELNRDPSPALEQARLSLMKLKLSSGSAKIGNQKNATPFVGRDAELQVIQSTIQQSVNAAVDSMILITGDPGIGKTRLLENIRQQVNNEGGTVLWGAAHYVEMNRPYAPWSELLEGLNPDVIPDSILQHVAPLLPGSTSASHKDGGRNRMFNAVLKLLNLLGSNEKPLGILFDNLQWFDDPSLALLNYISRETGGSNIFIACTARIPELEENKHAFWLIHDHRREQRLRLLELQPLSSAETHVLLTTIDDGLDTGHVFRKTQGNPLFAQVVAYAMQADSNKAIPDSIFSLMQDRISLLDKETKNLLNWAAVWGHDFSLELLSSASGYPLSRLLPSVEALEHYNIIRSVDGNMYNFAHDLIQQAAYENISEPRRKIIHRSIAQTLIDDEKWSAERSVAILNHASEGDDDELAAYACLKTAQKSLELFAFKEAHNLVKKGLSHINNVSHKDLTSLKTALLGVYVHPGMRVLRPPELVSELQTCIGRARKSGNNALMRKGLFFISNLYYQQENFHSALERIIKAEKAGRSADPVTMVRAIADTAKCFGMLEQQIDRAETLAHEARGLAEEMDLDNIIYEIPLALALIHHHRGDYENARKLYHNALEIIRNEGNHWWECYVLQQLPMTELEQNRPAAALAVTEQLLFIAEKMDQGSEAPFARALHNLSLYIDGNPEAVSDFDRELQTLRRIDSKWMLAYLQTLAAGYELGRDHSASARKRIDEAIAAASCVGRESIRTWACSLLVQLYLKEGKRSQASSMLASLKKEVKSLNSLSYPASEAFNNAIIVSAAKT